MFLLQSLAVLPSARYRAERYDPEASSSCSKSYF
jgi:hypothetical protein